MSSEVEKTQFIKNYKALCYFAWEMVNDANLAEDLVQDAYVSFLMNKKSISNDEQAIKSFLYSSVRNAVYNLNRKSKTVLKYLQRQDFSAVDEVDYEHRIIRAEFMAAVHLIVADLPDACQQIFKLSYFEGLSNQEISEQLALSVNTIKTQKQRALRVLRHKLDPELFLVLLLLYFR
ncbi:sigma-70 family RNA polymerase sigma factor [Solitalea lacus]|uniref:sigma-70 family RNA polymerase sigma factor n=1 Tax=Solitalea lacus TaxID=2911172 RepID=UPI001EDABDF5|nr:sigma-70 family RNA polymerase sigma factor [Solitalea lacus]UKJ09245.1 sigma-70 family RNA polymerase sigma factor [Solitalea lacus]